LIGAYFIGHEDIVEAELALLVLERSARLCDDFESCLSNFTLDDLELGHDEFQLGRDSVFPELRKLRVVFLTHFFPSTLEKRGLKIDHTKT
jgi:hypothetical protein